MRPVRGIPKHIDFIISIVINIIRRIPCQGKVRPADKLQVKAATILHLVGLARSTQDPINRGHGAEYFFRPPPAGVSTYMI